MEFISQLQLMSRSSPLLRQTLAEEMRHFYMVPATLMRAQVSSSVSEWEELVYRICLPCSSPQGCEG